jgi:hypothetical protein
MREEDICGKVVEQIGIWVCGVAEWTGGRSAGFWKWGEAVSGVD